jgi:5-methylcytosine-specific restriction endonuclease McrA
MKKYWVDFRANNPDHMKKVRMNQPSRNRTHYKRAVRFGGVTEKYSVNDVINIYGTECHICNLPINMDAPRSVGKDGWENGLHIDHVMPLSKGGSDTLENLRPSHGYCNIIKASTVQS